MSAETPGFSQLVELCKRRAAHRCHSLLTMAPLTRSAPGMFFLPRGTPHNVWRCGGPEASRNKSADTTGHRLRATNFHECCASSVLCVPKITRLTSWKDCVRAISSLGLTKRRSWLPLVRYRVNGAIIDRAFTLTRTPAVSTRRAWDSLTVFSRPEQHALRPALLGSPRRVSSTGAAARATEPGTRTPAADAASADKSVLAVAGLLVSLIKKRIRSDVGTVTPQTELETLVMRDDRHWDCLDTVEFLLDVEEMFSIVIPDEDADNFRTIEEIADFVTKHHRLQVAGNGAQSESGHGNQAESRQS